MARALRWIASFAAVAFILLWLAPLLIDGDRFREPIARIASAAAGRPVRIEGAVGVELLPEPVLAATRVTIPDQGDGIALSVRAVRLRIGLAALLTGRIEARELVLRRPELDLPWPLAPGALTRRLPVWITGFSARVEGGTLRLGSAARAVTFGAIDASVGTDPDTSALVAQGSAGAFARDWHFTARLGRPGLDGIAGIDLTADGQGEAQDTGAKFSGRVLADGAVVGDLSARGPDLGALVPAPKVPWQAQGRLAAAAGLASANDLSLVIGGSPAHGSVSLLVGAAPRLDLALAVGRLDLDAWLPALLQGEAGLPTGIDLSAQSATLAGGTLRQLHGQFALEPGHVDVKDAEAVLPGETAVQLRGVLTRPDNGPGSGGGGIAASGVRFDGRTSIAASDLRPALAWLRPFAPAMPDALLANLLTGAPRRAELSASLSVGQGAIAADAISGTIEGARVSGRIALSRGAPPRLTMALATDRADLSAILPALRDIARGRAPLALALSVSAGHVIVGPVTLDGLALEASADERGVTVTRLQADLGGAALLASGGMRPDGSVQAAKLSLTAEDAASVHRLLPAGWGGPVSLWQGPFAALAALDGPADAIALTATLSLGDLRIEALPVISDGGTSWVGPVTLRHPGARRLAEAAGLGDAAWLGEGSAALVAQLSATPHLVSLDNLAVNAGALRASGSLAATDPFGLDGVGLAVSGRIAAAALPLPLPASWHDPMPLDWLKRLDLSLAVDAADVQVAGASIAADAQMRLVGGGGAIRLDVARARVAGGDLSGHAGLALTSALPGAALEMRLAGGRVMRPWLGLPIDVSDGTIDLKASLEARGYSPAALAATVAGQIEATVHDGAMVGFDLARAGAALRAHDVDTLRAGLDDALAAGSTRFARLSASATLADGVATLRQAMMEGPDGTVTLGGTVDPLGHVEDLQLTLQPSLAGAPAIGLRVAGTQRASEIAGALLWLAQRP